MSEFLSGLRRRGVSLAFAVGALLSTGSEASADTIFLNDKGLEALAEITEAIKPARPFMDASGVAFIRCRILAARSGDPCTIQFEAWSPKGADDADWSARPYEIGADMIKSVQHEVDGHLDLQLMLSSRDEQDGSGKTAPIGTPAWATRMRRALDPNNALGMVVDRPGVAPTPPETEAELNRVTHRGWLIHRLAVEPILSIPSDVAGRREYDRLMAERQKKQLEEFQRDGLNVLHPRTLARSGREALVMLIEGIARAEKYRFLAARQEAENRDKATVPEMPSGIDTTDVPTGFVARATFAAGFVCSFAEMPQSSGQYWAYGREARDALITILEQANPDKPTPTAPPGRLSVQAALPVDAAEKATAAMRVVVNYATFWEAEARDVRRYLRALLMLARTGPDGSSPRRDDLVKAARATLVRTLRPDLNTPPAPGLRMGGARDLAAEQSKRTESADTFRAALDPFITDPDPSVREAVQAVLAHAMYNAPGSEAVIDELFGLATGDAIPESADRDARRASRRYAITILTVLGCLSDPRSRASQQDRDAGKRVFERLQLIRTQVETGNGSKGQAEFLALLPELHRRITDDPDLSDRAARFLVLEKDHVTEAAGAARRRLEAIAAGTETVDEEEATRLAEEARRLSRRAANLRTPN